MEDVSSGYSSTEFLPTDSAGAVDTVTRRTGSVRQSSRGTRPASTIVDKPAKNGANGSDVSCRYSVDSRLIQMIDFLEDGGGRRRQAETEGCH